MKHAFKPGDKVIATTTATDIPAVLRMAPATVFRRLGDDERDPEVGPMYEIVVSVQVFEDELRGEDD